MKTATVYTFDHRDLEPLRRTSTARLAAGDLKTAPRPKRPARKTASRVDPKTSDRVATSRFSSVRCAGLDGSRPAWRTRLRIALAATLLLASLGSIGRSLGHAGVLGDDDAKRTGVRVYGDIAGMRFTSPGEAVLVFEARRALDENEKRDLSRKLCALGGSSGRHFVVKSEAAESSLHCDDEVLG